MLHLCAVLLSASLAATVGVPTSRPPGAVGPLRDADSLLTSPFRHVRAYDADLERVLALGMRRSPTFAWLLRELEGSDVIVQIVASPNVPAGIPARLLLARMQHTHRYLRIEVRKVGTDDDLIAVIGHELQHAVEVAGAPDVRDASGLRAFYRRIGHQGVGANGFDTQAAHDVGRQIRRELFAGVRERAAQHAAARARH